MSSDQLPPRERADAEPAEDEQLDRRGGRRIRLPLQTRLKVDSGDARHCRVRELSPVGMLVDAADGDRPGLPVLAIFDGYPEVCEAFVLQGRTARLTEGPRPGLAIEIDREVTSAEVLRRYRQLVLHFLHHKPLLSDLDRGFFEGRCPACGWLGRVGRRKPVCSRCGQPVEPPKA